MTTSPSPAPPPSGRLLVLPVPDGQQVVVVVAGEADLSSAPLLRHRLLDSLVYRPRSLVVDATDLTFCDLSGLDALVDTLALVERSGVSVTVRPSDQLAWLMAIVPPSPSDQRTVGPGPARLSASPSPPTDVGTPPTDTGTRRQERPVRPERTTTAGVRS